MHHDAPLVATDTTREHETPSSPEMLSILRHDLRTPINVIIGYSEMWQEDDSVAGNPLLCADIDKINLAGRQLQSLVSDILDPARHDMSAVLDVRGLGVILRHAFTMPIRAVLGYSAVLCEAPDSENIDQLRADLHRIETAAQRLMSQAENLAAFGRLPAEQQDQEPAGPLHDHVKALMTRFRSEGRRQTITPAMQSGRILVVDDNESNSDLLSRCLQRHGYAVTVASDGIAALELIELREFDLVLLDVVMPLMNGLEVLKCLRCIYSVTGLPVIMITARDDNDDIVLAMENGANDYLTKPFAQSVVIARVRTQLLLKQMVLALEEANQKLEILSLSDELTQLANRRCFDDVFDREKRRAQRHAKPLSLILIDVDNFKGYNDIYGHEAGDRVLQWVAEAISQSLHRASDMAFRYGGDEFAVLLPGSDAEGALIIGERIRLAVERLAIQHTASTSTARVTVSIGTATTIQSSAEQLAAIFEYADRMLYRAKSEGRNRVCHYWVGPALEPGFRDEVVET